MNEIGSKVYITSIDDIEIDPVKKSGSTFIVSGTASLEVETDLGDGDTTSDSYPMTFTYEFDDEGKIVNQLRREIDTSAFFEGADDFDDLLVESISSEHLAVFESSVSDVLSLLADPNASAPKCLHRLLFVNVITAMECFLSDFFISRLKSDSKLLRKMVETTPVFKTQTFAVSSVFQTVETIEKRALSYLTGLVWHRLDSVIPLYEKTLGVGFPSDMTDLRDAIAVRHAIVHRNGKKQDGTECNVGEKEVRNVIKVVQRLVQHIENRWVEVSSPL